MNANLLSGVTGKDDIMTAITATLQGSRTGYLPLLFAGLLGLGVVFVGGHLQASALHDAAHDVRHATGFPCH